jgi:hypothetical protein
MRGTRGINVVFVISAVIHNRMLLLGLVLFNCGFFVASS